MRLLLDRKAHFILSQLLSTNSSLTVEELSHAADISSRSTYYSLKCINSELRRNGIDELRSVRNLGISPTPSARSALKSYLADSCGKQFDYFSAAERRAVIVCATYICDGITLDKLARTVSATKRTIQSDIGTLNDHLERYHVQIVAHTRRGMRLIGDEIDRRYVVMYYLDPVISIVDAGALAVDWFDESASERMRLDAISRAMGVTYTEDLTTRLAVILHYANEKEFIPRADLSAVEQSQVKRLVDLEFPELTQNTQLYASLILMTRRLQDIDPHLFEDDKAVAELFPVAEMILNRYADLSGTRFKNRGQLRRFLMQHLFYSRACYRYSVAEINPLCNQVELEYPEIYEMTRITLESLQEQIPYPITSGEIAYITLLIGSNIVSRNDSIVRILVVCGSGISAAQMIKQELEGLHPLIRVVAVASYDQWQLYSHEADLVVSSIALEGCSNAVIVHPVLTNTDKAKIRRALARWSYAPTPDIPSLDYIMKGIIPYIKDGSAAKVRNSLARSLGLMSQGSYEGQAGLLDLADPNRICIVNSHEMQWEDIIRATGQLLVDDDSIRTKYLDACIRNVTENGDYSMYPNGTYLVHAAPESGVNRLSVAIAILSDKVPFPSGAKAQFIIILAPSDYHTHIRFLIEAVRVFSDQTFAEEFASAQNSASAYQIILDHQNASKK